MDPDICAIRSGPPKLLEPREPTIISPRALSVTVTIRHVLAGRLEHGHAGIAAP